VDIHRKRMRTEVYQTAHIYRHLLKAVKKHIGKEENKKHFLEFVTSEFHKNRNLSDGVAVQQKIKLARDYTFLLNSVHHHKVLLCFSCSTQTCSVSNLTRYQQILLLYVYGKIKVRGVEEDVMYFFYL
jgi:hypothetical protein